MTAPQPPTSATVPRRLSRRARSLLAAGLVLGLGATSTSAAWTDTTVATGTFSVGTFAIELNVDGQWSPTREMTFDASDMYPGTEVYASVLVRTTSDTDLNGKVSVAGAGASSASPSPNIASILEYSAVVETTTSDGLSCNSGSFGVSADYVFGGPDSYVGMTAHPSESTQELASEASSILAYCFRVRLPVSAPSSTQGTTAQHTWTLTAESVSPEVE